MNVVEAYIKYKKQLIILISGMSGTDKTQYAKYIERDFKIQRINLQKYYKKDYNKIVEIEGKKIVDWDDIASIDWDSFNADIEKSAKKGVIVSGFAFPNSVLTFVPDFHLHIKINKKTLIEKRHKFLEKNKNESKFKEQYELMNTPLELTIINKISYPHYLKYIEESTIHKFLNANEHSVDDLYGIGFDYIIGRMKSVLDKLLIENPSIKNMVTEDVGQATPIKLSTDDDSSSDNDNDDDIFSDSQTIDDPDIQLLLEDKSYGEDEDSIYIGTDPDPIGII